MATHTTFRSFSAALSMYGADTVRGRVTAIAMEGARVLAELTPVDTGRAKGNWQATVDRPAKGEIDRLGKKPAGTADPTLSAETLDILDRWKPGQMIWFHNGVPYISILNDGGGGRTPHHMLERTVDHLKTWLGA